MNNKIKKQRHFSNSSWIRTKVVWQVRDNSGEVTAKDIVDAVGRGGVIDSDRVMHEQKYEYIGRKRA